MFLQKQFVASPIARRIKAKNSSFGRRWQSATIWNARHAERVWISLFALTLSIAASRTVAAGDWRQNYIVRNGSELPDGRYAVLVLLKQAAVDQDQTEGNAAYLANLQTHRHLAKFAAPIISMDKPSRLNPRVILGFEVVCCNGLGSIRFCLEFDSGTKRFHFYANGHW